MSGHKWFTTLWIIIETILVRTGRAHCFHDCIYITPPLPFSTLCVVDTHQHLHIYICKLYDIIYIYSYIYIYIYIYKNVCMYTCYPVQNTLKKITQWRNPTKLDKTKKLSYLHSTFYILQLEYVHWALSYFLMQFWKFSNISWSPKILRLQSFDNSWCNTYISFLY